MAAQQTAEQQKRQQDAVATARRAFEYSQAQMSAGTVNILTVLNTENALFSAQDELVRASGICICRLWWIYSPRSAAVGSKGGSSDETAGALDILRHARLAG